MFRWLSFLALIPAIALGFQPAAAQAATTSDWPAYLFGQGHSSDNTAATAITTANAGSLVHDWTWVPPAPTMTGQPSGLFASPTVVGGVVYIGAETGLFYALNESTGTEIWHQNLGFVKATTCGALGITSTATVEPAPAGGPVPAGTLTVYVSGGDGNLYALNAATGAIIWKSQIDVQSTTVNDYYDWSSPTVVNGNVYIGLASNCDNPLIMGGLKEFNQATGAFENFYQTNPGQSIGASIWSSAAVDPAAQNVFVTTGNGPAGDAVSVVKLNAATLAREDAWQVPSNQHGGDSDFGGSPTLFTATISGVATPMVGACNKNGVYYAFKQGSLRAGPVWQRKIGSPPSGPAQCDAAAIWDGSHLFIAGNQTTVKGVTVPGSIAMVDPASGTVIWQTGLTEPPTGSPTLDGSGVIAVPEFGSGTSAASSQFVLINAATGAVLKSITVGADFGQPVFADNMVFVPTHRNGLIAYSAPGGPTASFTFNCTNLTCSFDGSGSSGGVTAWAWDFGDGTTGSGVTISHTFGVAGTYSVKLTVTGSGGQTSQQTQQVTVPPVASPIAFVAATGANGDNPTETVTVPASVTAGNALILIATGAYTGALSAPAGWTLVGTETGNGVMVTSVWSRVATATDAGSKVTVTFSTTNHHGDVQLLAYSGTSTTSPVLALAMHADHVTTSKATTPTISVTTPGSWVVSGWQAKSSTVTAITAPSGQVVRNIELGSGTGFIVMLGTDYGAAVPVGTAGGLIATTVHEFSADTTLTLVLGPA